MPKIELFSGKGIATLVLVLGVGIGGGWGGSQVAVDSNDSVYNLANIEQRVTDLERRVSSILADVQQIDKKVNQLICMQIMERRDRPNWERCLSSLDFGGSNQ